MTIEMGILQINTGNYEVIHVATTEIFYQFWLPACKCLSLQLISHFHDGYLNVVSVEDIPRIVEELICLHSYTLEQEDLAFMGILVRSPVSLPHCKLVLLIKQVSLVIQDKKTPSYITVYR
jgi:hypothetical protein